jgi:hypothetical protein
MNRITVLAAAGLTVALAGTGLAAADAVTSTPTYHGCVVGTSRTLEHVYTSKTPTCPSGSFAAKWNQTGPRGPQGIQGPPGPAGPSTAGPAGLDEQEVTGVSGTNNSIAYCPADHPYVLGGGFHTVPGNTSVQQDVITSVPDIPTGGGAGAWGRLH